MRIALGIEYNGNRYHGWQQQAGLNTIQQEVERALSLIADKKITLTCAGRTDTGVHATNQVVHFDTDVVRDNSAWVYGTNNYLPKDISVQWMRRIDSEWHARFSATQRRYLYAIYNGSVRPAILHGSVTWQLRRLDHDNMAAAASYLIGEHDFTSFRSVECQSNTPNRNIKQCTVCRHHDLVVIDVIANAFLHHMVRNLAGALMVVGMGKRKPEWMLRVLEANDRSAAAETAPPYGLYLAAVDYPAEFNIPSKLRIPFFLPQHDANSS